MKQTGVRIDVAFTVKKGDRDSRGRWLRPGPRFKLVREGEPGYDIAPFGVMFMEIMPRFRMKGRHRVSRMYKSRPPYTKAQLEKASRPWLSNINHTEVSQKALRRLTAKRAPKGGCHA